MYGEVYKYVSEKSEMMDGMRMRMGMGMEVMGMMGREEMVMMMSGRGRANAYAVKELNKRKLANVRVGLL